MATTTRAENRKTRTPDEDLDLIQSFSSDHPYRDQERRARALLSLRPSTASACPRSFAGKRCRAHSGEPCACETHMHVLDHARRWIHKDGGPVLTADPYDFTGGQFAALVADCDELGLSVSVHGFSPYFPGRAILIMIRRQRPGAPR